MIRTEINCKSYDCPNQWGDLTLQKFAELHKLFQAHEGTSITDELRVGMLSLLGDIRHKDAERIALDDLRAFVDSCFQPFIQVLLHGEYIPTGMTSFKFKNKVFLLPSSGVDVLDNPTPMDTVTAKEFCDASDIVATSNLALAPLLVAILCRPKKEAYDEAVIKKRAKAFSQLRADVYLELLVLLSGAHSYLANEYPGCYKPGDSTSGESTSWSDRVLLVADNKPSELPIVEEMKAYDFIRLLSGKIKQMKEQCAIPRMF